MMSPGRNASPLCVTVGPLATNCYLVPIEAGTLIVDPGDEAARIASELKRAGLGAPVAILLTHGHPDHAGAAAELSRRFSIPVYAHEAERPWLQGVLDIWGVRTPAVDCSWITEGVAMPGGVEVLHTPGHTPGSVCFVLGEACFCGDTVFSGSVGRTDLPGGDYGALMTSLRLLAERLAPDSHLFPGHGPSTTMRNELARNPFVREALRGAGTGK
jgi:hydroxyacylglutathione hydrolase